MLDRVLEALTGLGLSASAGLNAYIPLLALGMLDRYTGLVELPDSWRWLSNGWVIAILVALLAVEVVADKIPMVDHVNDVLHTVIRPTAGGLSFGAASGSKTEMVTDPGSFFSSHQWVPIATGAVIALCVHGVKATARPVINVSTLGFGAPVASTIEDVFSTAMSLVAIVLPVLIVVFLAAIVLFFVWARRRRRRRKAEKAALRAARSGRAAGPGLAPGADFAPGAGFSTGADLAPGAGFAPGAGYAGQQPRPGQQPGQRPGQPPRPRRAPGSDADTLRLPTDY